MILLTGAAGKTGRAVLAALRDRGAEVRAFVRRQDQETVLRAAGAAEVVVGDLADAALYQRAAHGVSAIYHICPNMHPEEVELGEIAIRAAQQGGCPRLVFHSVLHPQTEAMAHHWKKLRVEEELFESGLDFTILQPAAYMQNLTAGLQAMCENGVLEVPYSTSSRFSLVDLGDVAEAATIVLCEPGHEGAIYELCGPERLSSIHIAEILTRVFERPVDARELSIEAWRRRAAASGLSEYARSTLESMFRYYDRYGLWGNPRVLTSLLGRQPTRFVDVAIRQMS